jgi:hypothetical protein
MLNLALSKKRDDERLTQLPNIIQPVRNEFRVSLAALRQGQQWMIDIAHILDTPLPELGMPKSTTRLNQGIRVQRQLNRYLSRLKKQRGALITVNKKLIHIGYFEAETDAAMAYNRYVIENNLEDYALNNV